MISFKIQNLCLSKDLNEILCELDKKISKLAKDKLDSIRYGLRCSIDSNRFYILTRYKQILILKINNSSCLCEYEIEDIITIIKQYLTSGKVIKFSTIESSETGFKVSNIIDTPSIVINYNYKTYGDVLNISNTSLTKDNYVSDEWDQIDF